MKLSEIKITPIIDSIKLLDISDQEYFGSKYSKYISNSRLNLLKPEYNGSPEKFFAGISANPQFSDALLFGSAIHELVLQPESFYVVPNINRPTAKAGMMADELYRPDGKEPTFTAIKQASDKLDYYKGSMNTDKADALKKKCIDYWESRAAFEKDNKETKNPIYLSEKDRTRLELCLDALKKNSDIQELLYPKNVISGYERTLLMDVKIETPTKGPFILHLKSKLDNFTIDREENTIIVNDLKTTGRYASEFSNAIEKFCYNREMAMYCWLLSIYAQHEYNMNNLKIRSNFLVVESIPTYQTKVVPMTKDLFRKGIKEFTSLLRLVAFYCIHGYEEFEGVEFMNLINQELDARPEKTDKPLVFTIN